jgi:ABC-type polysaccharide/polyol phosphate transport system ATPase subunit
MDKLNAPAAEANTAERTAAIQVNNLSKKYRLFNSPRQRLKEALDPRARTYHKDFWALHDINFAVPTGHTVGIIGRNGSGKSTLLQILTGVMPPSSGRVDVVGRVIALLELGAGFDPDFTGRENVRQYSRLQGLSGTEIEARLSEVEAFAEIGEFFDREVRQYSSGMFARLAFAAAINVDPDVLILDEILTVGDARFQLRCYERIRNFQKAGKTVVIVSHDLETIIDHCDSAILLDKGRLVAHGPPRAVTDLYREILFDEVLQRVGLQATGPGDIDAGANANPGETTLAHEDDRAKLPPSVATMLEDASGADRFPSRAGYNPAEVISGESPVEFLDFRIEANGKEAHGNEFVCGTCLNIYVLIHLPFPIHDLEFGFALRRKDGHFIYGTNTVLRPAAFAKWSRGNKIVFAFGLRLSLGSGSYFADLGVFRMANVETVRLKIRRNTLQIVCHHTPHFDGSADIGISPLTGELLK